MKIIKTDLENILSLRNDYLDSLAEFQELYLELMLVESSYYIMFSENESLGYIIINKENILIEYYLTDKFVPYCFEYFIAITNKLNITKVYCKSFDYLLLKSCIMFSNSYKLFGTLFRDYYITEAFHTNDISVRIALETDLPFLLEQTDELYESPEELIRFVKQQNVLLFQLDNCLMGCGYIIKVHKDWNYYDIGMWTNSKYRRQGIGSYIISYLKQLCINNKWLPICGCAIDNIASKKTLEKNGFISKHNLIEFELNAIKLIY